MVKDIKRIKLYVKDSNRAHKVEEKLKESLLKHHFEINDKEYDLLISIGGDGTFLKMIHDNNFENKVYYAAVNAGSLGFLSSIDKDIINEFVKELKDNNYVAREMNILKTNVYYENKKEEYLSINEFTIRKSDFSSLRCDIFVNDKLLDKYIGDGLVISTSIGSTGYNLALGGSIIDNDIKAISLTPIAPINNGVYKSIINSIVLDSRKKITIVSYDKSNISILNDGKITTLQNVCKVESTLLVKNIECIVGIGYNYIDSIRTKIVDSKEK